MVDLIVAFFGTLPTWLGTMALAATPVGELRLAIPVAIQIWEVSAINAYGLAILGNLIPFVFLYFGLERVRVFAEKRIPWVTRFIDAQIDRSKKRVQKKYARYGALALFLFTALPLPLTGLWTATMAAVALKVPLKPSVIGITSGVFVSGIIVTIITLGVTEVF